MAEKKANAINENDKLVDIVSAVIKLPGVRVNRKEFLLAQFKDSESQLREDVLLNGPFEAGFSREEIRSKASKLLLDRTLASTGASFVAGLPGGLAMAAAIPADMMQYYAVALRTAQEIAYLYGEGDLWQEGLVDDERVRNQLVLYCGVMFGATGAAQTVRVLTSALAKQSLKKLPQQALTKTIYYPIIKSICKFFGVHMTKGIFAKGVSKAIPVFGGIVSGGITFATMRPMGMRLIETMDGAHFDYSQTELKKDWDKIIEVCEAEGEDVPEEIENAIELDAADAKTAQNVMDEITQAKNMLDAGILTQEEFTKLKEKLIANL